MLDARCWWCPLLGGLGQPAGEGSAHFSFLLVLFSSFLFFLLKKNLQLECARWFGRLLSRGVPVSPGGPGTDQVSAVELGGEERVGA
jgi:hypothetical protein